MTSEDTINRRRHERFRLPPMYSAVTARPCGRRSHVLEGHAYDISEAGIRIELDDPLAPGDRVAVNVDLAGGQGTVGALATVVWVNDAIDDPGARRMALQFDCFESDRDREHLARYLGTAERLAA
ncbi:MAG: PilZ domain-containing protein [Planctomycetota bacterium]|jgi:hypothetical protein